MFGFIEWLFGGKPHYESKSEKETRILSRFNGKDVIVDKMREKLWFKENKKFFLGAKEYYIRDIVLGEKQIYVRGERLNNAWVESISFTLTLPKEQA